MTRRMTLIVLALVGLMVVVVTASPPQSPRSGPNAATPTPSSATAFLTDPDAFDVSETLSAAREARPRTVTAEVGDRVEIMVEGTLPDSVLLGDYESAAVEAGIPARFELLAETPGTYPLVLANENRRIGAVEIR